MSFQSDEIAWLKSRQRFEYIDEDAYKFWEIQVVDRQVHRRFGRIGAKGRTLVRIYSDSTTAMIEAEKMIDEKLLDGYQAVAPGGPDKIQIKGLARLERQQVNPLVKKSVRVYANTTLPFCEPRFLKFDPSNTAHRLSDQILGGFPYTSEDNPWPKNRGGAMQFLAQIDLAHASQLLGGNFGSGLLQVWAHYYDTCDEFLLRVISQDDLVASLDTYRPKDIDDINRNGMLSLEGMGVKSSRIEWKSAQPMHYPHIWSRICGSGEVVEVIHPADVDDALSDFSDRDDWARGINRPTFHGLRGRDCSNIYLGGYPFGEGNGWDLHNPSRRALLNLWSDTGVLWHLCVWITPDGKFGADVACTR